MGSISNVLGNLSLKAPSFVFVFRGVCFGGFVWLVSWFWFWFFGGLVWFGLVFGMGSHTIAQAGFELFRKPWFPESWNYKDVSQRAWLSLGSIFKHFLYRFTLYISG